MHQIETEAGPLLHGGSNVVQLENEHALKILPSVKGLRGGLSGVVQLAGPSCQHLDYSLTLSIVRVYAERLFFGIQIFMGFANVNRGAYDTN